MKKLLRTLKSEDWIIVFAGAVILAIALLFPNLMPSMPKSLATGANWLDAGYIFVFLLALTYITNFAMGRKLRGILLSFLTIFVLTLLAQMTAAIPFIKEIGLEAVFFAVVFGLIISNCFGVPEWLKPAIQSEFYIKVGIVCLGATILFGEVVHSGLYALLQALIVVCCVWYFAFHVSRKRFKVDDEMATMLASSVSICGVSAAIATAGAIKGDGKKLSYIISLVLVCAIPMMYLMPWIANLVLPLILSDPTAIQEVAGAWMGGTIDTTGAVVASGSLLGETAEKTAVIVKSSQNVLLGLAAFIISLYWAYRGKEGMERPTPAIIWGRFPKFVVGFILASLVFSIFFATDDFEANRKMAKSMSTTLFSVAFVCIGLETRFKDIFSKENRQPLKAFLTAQGFNIVVTFVVSLLLFGVIKPWIG